jgi:hypothetical protein
VHCILSQVCVCDLQEGLDTENGANSENDASDSGSSSEEVEEADFIEYMSRAFMAKDMDVLSKGWTAFIVGIVTSQVNPC